MHLSIIIWLLLIIAVVTVAKYIPKTTFQKKTTAKNLSVYKKKTFLFDAVSEFNLFKLLVKIAGDNYYVFPQVNYSHLIEVKGMNWREQRKYRSSIDRKSADFVICDKERIVPQLIIELDGSVHSFTGKQKRDKFINNLTEIVGLPILHLKVGNLDEGFVQSEINKKLRIEKQESDNS